MSILSLLHPCSQHSLLEGHSLAPSQVRVLLFDYDFAQSSSTLVASGVVSETTDMDKNTARNGEGERGGERERDANAPEQCRRSKSSHQQQQQHTPFWRRTFVQQLLPRCSLEELYGRLDDHLIVQAGRKRPSAPRCETAEDIISRTLFKGLKKK